MLGTFAGTPPLEGLRMLLSMMVTVIIYQNITLDPVLVIIDVRRAHFHPYAKRELFIQLPDEDWEEGMVGLLLRTMYGSRDAASSFEDFFNEVMVLAGFLVGSSSPCLYCKKSGFGSGWRHGDDSAFLVERSQWKALYDFRCTVPNLRQFSLLIMSFYTQS